jgi:hypothetical protein
MMTRRLSGKWNARNLAPASASVRAPTAASSGIAVAQGWQLGCPLMKLLGISGHECLRAGSPGLQARVTVSSTQRGECASLHLIQVPRGPLYWRRSGSPLGQIVSALAAGNFIGPVADTFSGSLLSSSRRARIGPRKIRFQTGQLRLFTCAKPPSSKPRRASY